MPTTPYAKLLASVNGGAAQDGGITCAIGDDVDFTLESTVGVIAQRFEIYDYPIGFSCPSGWSVDSSSGAYYYASSTTPPQVTVDTWGKYMCSVVVNNGLNSAGENDDTLTDTGTALSGALTGLSSSTPAAVATVGSAGVGITASRGDHVHALSFATVNTILGGASATVSINGQQLSAGSVVATGDVTCDQVFTGGALSGSGSVNLPATGSVYGVPSGGGTAASIKLLGWSGSGQRLTLGQAVSAGTDVGTIEFASFNGIQVDGAVITFEQTVATPLVTQDAVSGTGSANGVTLTIRAQDGQAQTGGAANTNGGNLHLAAGNAGSGGGGATGADGAVIVEGWHNEITARTYTEVTGEVSSAFYAATYASDVTLDWYNGNHQTITLTDNVRIFSTHERDGALLVLELKQDATGGRTANWSAAPVVFSTSPVVSGTLAAAANHSDVFFFIVRGANLFCYAHTVH